MDYDVIVIGSGPGGYVAAIRASQLGLKTACIEKGKLGGTCLNVGCIPSKALLHSTELYAKLSREYSDNGIAIEGAKADLARMMQRKEKIVAGFNQGIKLLFKQNKVDWIQGEAKLKSGTSVEVSGKKIEARFIILATGSEPIELPFLKFDEEKVLSSTGALQLGHLPKKLLIIGAGVIGVELGSVYQRLGTNIECIEFLDRICPAFDRDLSKGLQKSLSAQGMRFHLTHKVLSAKIDKNITLRAEGPNGLVEFQGDAVLVCIGRKPYTKNLGLNELGILQDQKGMILVDHAFRTNIPTIFAIGDLIDGPMLAHKASEEGTILAEILANHKAALDYASIPNVAYTHPEAAAVGFTEDELKAKQVPYSLGLSAFKISSRARCTGEEEGFVKVIAGKDGKLLGVHILGAHASELIAEASLAIFMRSNVRQIAAACHAHPTLSETLKEAATIAAQALLPQ